MWKSAAPNRARQRLRQTESPMQTLKTLTLGLAALLGVLLRVSQMACDLPALAEALEHLNKKAE